MFLNDICMVDRILQDSTMKCFVQIWLVGLEDRIQECREIDQANKDELESF